MFLPTLSSAAFKTVKRRAPNRRKVSVGRFTDTRYPIDERGVFRLGSDRPITFNLCGQVAQHSHREALFKELTEAPGVIWATAEVGSRRIDEINILEATKEAMAVSAHSSRVCGVELSPVGVTRSHLYWQPQTSLRRWSWFLRECAAPRL